jgi:hypothetical protein
MLMKTTDSKDIRWFEEKTSCAYVFFIFDFSTGDGLKKKQRSNFHF